MKTYCVDVIDVMWQRDIHALLETPSVYIMFLSWWNSLSLSCFKSQQLQLTHTVSNLCRSLNLFFLFPQVISSTQSLTMSLWNQRKLHNHVAVFFCSFIQIGCVCRCVSWASSDFRKYWDIIVRQFDLPTAEIRSQCLFKVCTDLHFLKE